MRFKISICVAVAAGMIGAGCVASRPVHYYTIAPATRTPNVVKPDGPVLLVGMISTSEALQDGRIRYRTATNDAGAYEYHRWVERPGTAVRNALARALRASGNYSRVLESNASSTGDYLLRGRLDEFGEVDGESIQTWISLHLELVDRKTNRTIWDRVLERQEPVRARKVSDVVQSLDVNLQQVVGELVAEIDKQATPGPRMNTNQHE
jgi:cholesterol transport system auxiliary component